MEAQTPGLDSRQPASPSVPLTRPQRPRELQDALNFHLYHPLAWQLARQLAKTPVTPNMVSVAGAVLVVLAGVAYSMPWGVPAALLGLFLHMSWHVVDGADGDLARMTGRSSPTGEMVDGLCDYLSHTVLYLTLGVLLQHQIGWLAWVATLGAGASHIVQANHVEVQRRQYQYWVYGTPWIRQTQADVDSTAKAGFGALLAAYLNVAAGMTPYALKIDALAADARGNVSALDKIACEARSRLEPLLAMLKILGPNPRALILGASMLAGSPLWYFLYYIALNLLLAFSVVRHNRAARRIEAALTA
ncbi:MAG: CDP-alcohol phosphatidyltransferase family protein [Novosphingobium sp.]